MIKLRNWRELCWTDEEWDILEKIDQQIKVVSKSQTMTPRDVVFLLKASFGLLSELPAGIDIEIREENLKVLMEIRTRSLKNLQDFFDFLQEAVPDPEKGG